MSVLSLKTRLDEAHAKRARGDEGFTLIELLVVVVIIGILVAIAIPLYLNYRKGAQEKATESDVRGAVSAVEQCFTDNGNAYPATPTSQGDNTATTKTSLVLPCGTGSQTAPISKDTDTLNYAYVAASKTYTLTGTSSTGKTYTYDSSTGKLS